MPEDSVQAAALSSHLQHLPGPTSAQNCSSTPEHPQQGGWGCGERDLGETGRQNLSPQKMGLSGPEGKRHIEFAGMPRILDTTSSGQWSPDEKCRGPVHRRCPRVHSSSRLGLCSLASGGHRHCCAELRGQNPAAEQTRGAAPALCLPASELHGSLAGPLAH